MTPVFSCAVGHTLPIFACQLCEAAQPSKHREDAGFKSTTRVSASDYQLSQEKAQFCAVFYVQALFKAFD